MEIVKRYQPEEVQRFPEMLATLVSELKDGARRHFSAKPITSSNFTINGPGSTSRRFLSAGQWRKWLSAMRRTSRNRIAERGFPKPPPNRPLAQGR